MGYRKVDPRTKAAAIKAMGKAVGNGVSPYAAARELSEKYDIGATTLQKYYADAAESEQETTEIANDTAEPRKRTRHSRATVTVVESEKPDPVEESAVEAVEDRTEGALVLRSDSSAANGDAGIAVSAEALSADFTGALQTISEDFVARLQAAALDDLIGKMQQLRDQLQHQ